MVNRAPRTNDRQRELPDAPGRWWFQGKCIQGITSVPVLNRPFLVAEENGELLTLVPDTGLPFDETCELVGWWTREEDMGALAPTKKV